MIFYAVFGNSTGGSNGGCHAEVKLSPPFRSPSSMYQSEICISFLAQCYNLFLLRLYSEPIIPGRIRGYPAIRDYIFLLRPIYGFSIHQLRLSNRLSFIFIFGNFGLVGGNWVHHRMCISPRWPVHDPAAARPARPGHLIKIKYDKSRFTY